MESTELNKATNVSPCKTTTSATKPDWSLRPNGKTYRDRCSESRRITRRLQNSTGSVTGIAGQRGVGKSSLVQRVLTNCEKRGAFTLLIHSPTDYDSKEFLVSVFQRICEEVVVQIDDNLSKSNSLFERGKDEQRRLRNHSMIVLLGIFVLLFSLIGSVAYFQLKEVTEVRRSEIETRISVLDQQAADLANKFSIAPNFIDTEQSDNLVNILDNIANERSHLRSSLNYTPKHLFNFLVIYVPIALIIYGALIFLFWYLFRILKKYRQAKKHPNKIVLRKLALDHIENLKFHTTLVKSGETGMSFGNLSTRLKSSKNLAIRPLSLPGLTSEFADFLEMIATVYKVDGQMGQVVICMDELDKIENSHDLDKLLRGIKGVLGRPGTHFLLTVSQDALSTFSTRRRMPKGIVESAFEEIISLDRIDLIVTAHIIELMCPKLILGEDAVTQRKLTTLFWFFGTGVPREIKRSVLLFLESDLANKNVVPMEIWKLLFLNRLNDLRSWVLRFGADDVATFRFLPQLQESIELFQTEELDKATGNWSMKAFILFWKDHLNSFVVEDIRDNGNIGNNSSKVKLAYGRAILDLILAASARVYAEDSPSRVLTNDEVEQLNIIFEFMPTNLGFAMNRTFEYIELTLQN